MYDVVQNIQEYDILNKEYIKNYHMTYGQLCDIYRYINTDEDKNANMLNQAYGVNRVLRNSSKLSKVGDVHLLIPIEELRNAFVSSEYSITLKLWDKIFEVGDVLRVNYLDSILEFIVSEEVKVGLDTFYEYRLTTRSSSKT